MKKQNSSCRSGYFWNNYVGEKKQGSALIIALALMVFITTLGTIVLTTAHALNVLSIARSVERPSTILLESLVVYACQAEGAAWVKQCEKTAGAQPHELHTTVIKGKIYTVRAVVENGVVVVQAWSPEKKGKECLLSAHLGLEGKQVVIRAWKKSL